MKNFFLKIIVFPHLLLILGCYKVGFGPGEKDFSAKINESLEISRSSADEVVVFSRRKNSNLVTPKVTGVALTEKRLFVERLDTRTMEKTFWTIDLLTEETSGPFNSEQLSELLQKLGLSPVVWTPPSSMREKK